MVWTWARKCFREWKLQILWGFNIQTDHVTEARRPDLVVVDNKKRSCKIIDFTVSGDSRTEEKVKRSDRKISKVGNGVTEDMEC